MIRRLLAAGLLAATAVAHAAALPSVLDRAESKASAIISPAVVEAIDAIPVKSAPLPAVKNSECRLMAAELIVRWEVTSPAYYDRRLSVPIWPKGASGITWGIGYDGGHQTRRTILDDWADHLHAARLADTSGITGQRAGDALPRYRDIQTPFPYAYRVFTDRSLLAYERQAERVFRVDMADQSPRICAVLLSLTYNRGGSMTGDSRREMRAIRDECLPQFDDACTARQIRSMCRLWRGTVNERGLCARRNMEADYATGAQP